MLSRGMRTIVAIALALVLALLAAAPAGAATRTLRGTFDGDPESAVALRVKHAHGEWFVRKFAAEEILISCGQLTQARLSTASISGLAPVDDGGRFEVRGKDGGTHLAIVGRLLNRRKARGSFRYRGPTVVDGETLGCDSGALSWSASR